MTTVRAKYPGASLYWCEEAFRERRDADRAVTRCLDEARLCGYGCEVTVSRDGEVVRAEVLQADPRRQTARQRGTWEPERQLALGEAG